MVVTLSYIKDNNPHHKHESLHLAVTVVQSAFQNLLTKLVDFIHDQKGLQAIAEFTLGKMKEEINSLKSEQYMDMKDNCNLEEQKEKT